jgi:hypothetical protein
VVGSDVATLLLFTHCTTEHGTKLVLGLLVTVSVNPALPARTVVGESGDDEPNPRVGVGRFVVGVEMVNCSEFDVPAELDTETVAVAFEAVSEGKIAAVSWVELITVVVRRDPFQFTAESLVKVVPVAAFTVRVNPLRPPQNGAETGERDAIAGGVPGAAPIVKRTIFDISVVVVLLTFDVADWAEPGIWTATWTVPVVARSAAGTGAVSWMVLTSVVTRGVPFHKINAPVTKPDPLAVIVKPCPPTAAELGLTNARMEEDVWMERFVL